MQLKDQIVLITGAGGQLGSSFAKFLSNQGAKLWLTDASESALTELVSLLPPLSVLGAGSMDVTSPESVKSFFLKVPELDVLINNAGIGLFTTFWDRDYDEFMKVLSVNVGGPFLCSREAIKIMMHKNKGSIINIGSIYGVISSDPRIYADSNRLNSEVYSASKAGVIQMTKYFATHAAPYGIRVNCVSPGGVFNNQSEKFVENYCYRTPFHRMANGNDICGAVAFLASSGAEYITGQNILVDGGFTAW